MLAWSWYRVRWSTIGFQHGSGSNSEPIELSCVPMDHEASGFVRREGGDRVVNETKYWVAFRYVTHVGPVRLQKLREHFGSAEAAWNAPSRDLRSVLDERAAASLLAVRQRLSPDETMERVERLGIDVLTLDDPRYPRLVAEIPVPPPVLFIKGALLPEDEQALAIVGTRRATSYGRQVTGLLASELAAAGLTIVSGLARGIDGVAHHKALAAGGRTIAVLASGVDIIYPSEHERLAEEIVASGALIADYPPGSKPDAPNFPARNRLISGLSLGTVIVEAPTRSGALITANFAADQGREVFAVPGSVLSAASEGSNRLLRDGARLARTAADILEDLGLGEAVKSAPVQAPLALSDDERRLFAMVGREPQHIDELVAAAGLPIAQGVALMTMLELKGFVENAGSQHYIAAPAYRGLEGRRNVIA